jgi:hypothetical protein
MAWESLLEHSKSHGKTHWPMKEVKQKRRPVKTWLDEIKKNRKSMEREKKFLGCLTRMTKSNSSFLKTYKKTFYLVFYPLWLLRYAKYKFLMYLWRPF